MAELEWGTAAEGLRVSASFDADSVLVGRPAVLTLVLENVSGGVLTVVSRSKWVDYRLTLSSEDGKTPRRTAFGEIVDDSADSSRRTNIELQPGERIVDEILLSRLFDMTVCQTYTVSAERDVYELGGNGSAVVTSNEAELRVEEEN